MAEWLVVAHDVFSLHALRQKVGPEDLVGGAWVDLVGSGGNPAFDLVARHQVINGGNVLLVRSNICIG